MNFNKIKDRKVNLLKASIISSTFLVVGYIIGYFFGDNVYSLLIIPFENSVGNFDYSIFWTAILGIATLILGIIVYRSTIKYQKEISISSANHQGQIEKLSRLNLDLTDKLVHLETFKYFPQVKVTFAENINVHKNEHVQLYCNTRDLYNMNMPQKELENQIGKIVCQLENVGESYIDQILFKEVVVIIRSNENIKRIEYRGKPESTGCSSLFINSNKNLIYSFQKSILNQNDTYLEVFSHYVIENGKTQLWETDWENHIYANVSNGKILSLDHCTSTRLNSRDEFSREVEKILRN